MSKTKEEMLEIIQKEVRRSSRTLIIFAIVCLLVGGFMIALHLLGLDSDFQNARMAAKVALYLVAILMIAGGFWMIYVALFKNSESGNRFFQILHEQPGEIAEIYVNCNVGTNPPFRIDIYTQQVPRLGHLSLVVSYTSKKEYRLPMKVENAGEIVHYCRQHAPHAFQ